MNRKEFYAPGETRVYLKKPRPRPSDDLISSVWDFAIDSEVYVYPNPIRDQLNIQLSPKWENQKLYLGVYDMKGQLIQEKRLDSPGQTLQLNTHHWPAGTMQLIIASESLRAYQKVVKPMR